MTFEQFTATYMPGLSKSPESAAEKARPTTTSAVRNPAPPRWAVAYVIESNSRMSMVENLNYAGSDLPGTGVKVAAPVECRDLCDRNQNCRAYTFVKEGVQGPNAMCWLKGSVPNSSRDTNTISGVKTSSSVASRNTPASFSQWESCFCRRLDEAEAAWKTRLFTALRNADSKSGGYCLNPGNLPTCDTSGGNTYQAARGTFDVRDSQGSVFQTIDRGGQCKHDAYVVTRACWEARRDIEKVNKGDDKVPQRDLDRIASRCTQEANYTPNENERSQVVKPRKALYTPW